MLIVSVRDHSTDAYRQIHRIGPVVVDFKGETAKEDRKRLQIEHAATLSTPAKLVKLADKICNLRDISESAPVDWSSERKDEYFTWAKQVVDRIRGVSPVLETLFDSASALRNQTPG
jgi:guanosine-3',5'-bis(diphosphate) 3'-pyrophosphohydrolase